MIKTSDTLTAILERRNHACRRVIDSLKHLGREHAIAIILNYMAISDVEDLANFQEQKDSLR